MGCDLHVLWSKKMGLLILTDFSHYVCWENTWCVLVNIAWTTESLSFV